MLAQYRALFSFLRVSCLNKIKHLFTLQIIHTQMKLTEKVNAITTREHFVSFVQSLADDFKRNPSEWENDNLLSFLSAVAAWVDDMDTIKTKIFNYRNNLTGSCWEKFFSLQKCTNN